MTVEMYLMVSTVAAVASALVCALVAWIIFMRIDHSRAEQAWRAERQQLLDRIQAPSFAELKQAEVKVIKAQQGRETEPQQIVPL